MLVFHNFPDVHVARQFTEYLRQMHKVRAAVYERTWETLDALPAGSPAVPDPFTPLVLVEAPQPYPGQEEDAVELEDSELMQIWFNQAEMMGGKFACHLDVSLTS